MPLAEAPVKERRPVRSSTARSGRKRQRKSDGATKAKEKGRLFVNVLGSWAHIYRKGVKLGTTPTTLSLPAGTHRLRLKNPETGREQAIRVSVAAGETAKVIERW